MASHKSLDMQIILKATLFNQNTIENTKIEKQKYQVTIIG